MDPVNYNQPIEIYKNERVIPAQVSGDYNGAGPVPIKWEGALEAMSANALARLGWRVRNVSA